MKITAVLNGVIFAKSLEHKDGALLNQHCKFYDKRIGQSVTLSGRQIVRHMMSHINEQITGKYVHDGDGIIYGDTDSCFFSAYSILKSQIESNEVEWNKDICIKLYDTIGENVNDSFPEFMEKSFHAPRNRGSIIKAGRELVADRGLFITKKKYAVNIYDKEGKRLDTDGKMGKMKIMGLEIKRSDTPKEIQDFLYKLLEMVLQYGKSKEELINEIVKFKNDFSSKPSWVKGSPRAANKLTYYTDLEKKLGKANMPGHIRASMNWNYLRRMNSDNYSMHIIDGMKVVVCKLKSNPLNMTSIAYPVDELRLPDWFTSLSFDDSEMERVLIDEKIENLFGILGWNLRSDTNTNNNFGDLFSFGD